MGTSLPVGDDSGRAERPELYRPAGASTRHRADVHPDSGFHRHGRRHRRDRAFRQPESGNQSISGQREDANGFLVNGGDVKEAMNGGTASFPISTRSPSFGY